MNGAWIIPGGHTRLSLEGVLDFDSLVPLIAESRHHFAGKTHLDVDLQGVRRTNSAGLALLLEWLELARRQEVSLRFLNPPESLMRLAAVTNISELLPMVEGRA